MIINWTKCSEFDSSHEEIAVSKILERELLAIFKLAPTDGFEIVASESEISNHPNVQNQVKFNKATISFALFGHPSLPSHIQRALMQWLLNIRFLWNKLESWYEGFYRDI